MIKVTLTEAKVAQVVEGINNMSLKDAQDTVRTVYETFERVLLGGGKITFPNIGTLRMDVVAPRKIASFGIEQSVGEKKKLRFKQSRNFGTKVSIGYETRGPEIQKPVELNLNQEPEPLPDGLGEKIQALKLKFE